MARRRALAHPVPARQTDFAIQIHGMNPPTLPVTGKGSQSGRVLLRRSGTVPPLPWSTFAPPLTGKYWRERFLSHEEYQRLGRVLDKTEVDGWVLPTAVSAIRLLLLTGCRRNEVITLRWDDIDRTPGELRLRDSKTGARRVPLILAVDWVLECIPRIEGNLWVITGANPGDHLENLDAIWHRLRMRAGLDDIRIHDCRHYSDFGIIVTASCPGFWRSARAFR